MRSLAPWGALPLLALPLNSLALGLGEIETRSFLNQPLNAQIPLTATAEELQGLSVTLAPISEFTRQGFDYPAVLQSVEVALGVNAAGENVILVTSSRPVSEFFLDLIIQVDHRSGSTIRQYTLLLDPPVFSAAEAVVEPIAAPVSNEPSAAVAEGAIVREQPAAPTQQPAPQTVAPAPASAPAPAQAAPEGGDYTVQGGDTLWGIAERYRPNGVTTNQVMITIYEANRSAFGGNINQLRRGAILRIPPASDLGDISASAATDEVRRQTEDWQAGIESEPRLVLLPPTEDTTSVDVGAASAALQTEVSDLEGELASLEDQLAERDAELAEARRLLELQSAELAELQANIVEPVATDDAIFEDERTAADPTPEAADDAADAAAAEDPAAEQPVEAVVSETPAQPSPAPAADEPSLVDRAIEIAMKPVTWFVAAAVLIVLLAIAFLRRRKDDEDDETGTWQSLDDDISVESEHEQTTQLPSPDIESDMVVVESGSEATVEEPIPDLDLGETAEEERKTSTGTLEIEALEGDDEVAEVDGSPTISDLSDDALSSQSELSDDTLSSQTVINLDQADPVAEADFHMAYGLYDQAADLLTQALATDPDNRDLKLKLLEVYFVWGNKDLFLEQARSFKQTVGSGAGSDWDKVVIMGKQICPEEEPFADATAISESIDLDFEAGSDEGDIDFTLEGDADDDIDLAFGDTDEAAATQELSSITESTEVLTGEDATLEIGAQTQAGLEAALLEDSDERTDAAITEEESPTVEVGVFSEDDAGDETHLGEVTQETPTLNFPADESHTIETPTIEAEIPGEGDTIEQPRPESIVSTTDMTAEINVDDLGLDVGDLGDLADDDELSATGLTRALDAGSFESESEGDTTEIFSVEEDADIEAAGAAEVPSSAQSEDDLDLNLDEFSAALDGDDTVEQPGPTNFGDVDLNIGEDVIADDEPTGTEESTPFDPESMTEIGTKLDLARAYIDMGDPEGARSILEEVLSEGDSDQRREAQSLIDALPGA